MLLDANAVMMADGDSDFDYVEIPEWTPKGAAEVNKVRVRSLTGDERSRFWARMEAQKDSGARNGSHMALACAMGMVDANGGKLFANEDQGAAVMGKKHPEIIDRIAGKILDMSKMTKASREELAKKSQTTTSDGGISSPEPSTQASDSTSTS